MSKRDKRNTLNLENEIHNGNENCYVYLNLCVTCPWGRAFMLFISFLWLFTVLYGHWHVLTYLLTLRHCFLIASLSSRLLRFPFPWTLLCCNNECWLWNFKSIHPYLISSLGAIVSEDFFFSDFQDSFFLFSL